MSRNSKNARKHATAKQWVGQKGPAKTTKVNKKRNTWYAKLAGTGFAAGVAAGQAVVAALAASEDSEVAS